MNEAMTIEEGIINILNEKYSYLYGKRVNIKSITLQEKVKLQCFHCSKYEQKWTCPPRVDKINFNKVFSEYENAMVIYCKMPFYSKEEYDKVRNDSTNILHKTLLKLEKFLYESNNSLAISFIGGSCKLCKDGCAKDKCRFPHLARIPLEATGANVIEFIKKELDMEVVFPLDKYMYRFGLLLW